MIVVRRLVTNKGMLPVRMPCTAKQAEPNPIIRKVPVAMSSVERVRTVRTVWGRYPKTMAMAAIEPIISDGCIVRFFLQI